MPRGVYPRTKKKADAPKRTSKGDGYTNLVAKLRAEKLKAEDRVVALGTAIEALEGIE